MSDKGYSQAGCGVLNPAMTPTRRDGSPRQRTSMVRIVNDDVAEYYGQQSHSYVNKVRDKTAYRRAISERERDFVLKHLTPGAKVLEIGCGPGFFTRELVKHAETVLATDISQEMVDAVRENIDAPNLTTACVDVNELHQLPHYGEYDTVVCMRVLCHVDDASVALSQVRGAAHPDGNVLFDLLNAYSYIHLGRKIRRRPLQHTKFHAVSTMREIVAENDLTVVDSFGRGYPYVGRFTMDKIGYKVVPSLAHGVGFNAILSKQP